MPAAQACSMRAVPLSLSRRAATHQRPSNGRKVATRPSRSSRCVQIFAQRNPWDVAIDREIEQSMQEMDRTMRNMDRMLESDMRRMEDKVREAEQLAQDGRHGFQRTEHNGRESLHWEDSSVSRGPSGYSSSYQSLVVVQSPSPYVASAQLGPATVNAPLLGLALLLLTGYATVAAAFNQAYARTKFSDRFIHRARLVILSPFLYLMSKEFRDEFRQAMEKKPRSGGTPGGKAA